MLSILDLGYPSWMALLTGPGPDTGEGLDILRKVTLATKTHVGSGPDLGYPAGPREGTTDLDL